MSAFDYFQLLVNLVFLFLILVMLIGRGWKRGAIDRGEQESYREMVSTLSALIQEMKDTSAEMQDRLGEKQLEIQRAMAAAEERIERLNTLVSAASTPAPQPAEPAPVQLAKSVQASFEPSPGRPEPRSPVPQQAAPHAGEAANDREAEPLTPAARSEEDGGKRKDKYRQALDLAQKGWGALDIARVTQLPRGEVELLMRTRGP